MNALAKLIEASGLSQVEIARRSGIARATIQDMIYKKEAPRAVVVLLVVLASMTKQERERLLNEVTERIDG